MADESEGGGGGGDGGDGGSVLKKYGPLAAIVLLAQVVLAWGIISFVFKDNVPEEEREDLIPEQSVELRSGQVEEKSRLPYYYSSEALGTITANPAGTNSERFVVLTVQLGLEIYDRDESPPDDDITNSFNKDNPSEYWTLTNQYDYQDEDRNFRLRLESMWSCQTDLCNTILIAQVGADSVEDIMKILEQEVNL